MTTYLFDTRIGESLNRGQVESELDGIGAARDEAVRALAELAPSVFGTPGVESISIEVTDVARKLVFRAIMSLSIEDFN